MDYGKHYPVYFTLPVLLPALPPSYHALLLDPFSFFHVVFSTLSGLFRLLRVFLTLHLSSLFLKSSSTPSVVAYLLLRPLPPFVIPPWLLLSLLPPSACSFTVVPARRWGLFPSLCPSASSYGRQFWWGPGCAATRSDVTGRHSRRLSPAFLDARSGTALPPQPPSTTGYNTFMILITTTIVISVMILIMFSITICRSYWNCLYPLLMSIYLWGLYIGYTYIPYIQTL